MLNYGWIIPAVPAVSFILILLFGKHFPKKGSEIGIAATRVRKEQEGDGHTRYLLSGLLFPHQGYMLQFHRRDAC